MNDKKLILEQLRSMNEAAKTTMIVKVKGKSLDKVFKQYLYDADSFYEFMQDIYGLVDIKDFSIKDVGGATEFLFTKTAVKNKIEGIEKLIKDMNGQVYDEFYNVVQLKGDEPDARGNGDDDIILSGPSVINPTININKKETNGMRKKPKKEENKTESTDAGSIPTNVGNKVSNIPDKLDIDEPQVSDIIAPPNKIKKEKKDINK